jgi:hypothetical protein
MSRPPTHPQPYQQTALIKLAVPVASSRSQAPTTTAAAAAAATEAIITLIEVEPWRGS